MLWDNFWYHFLLSKKQFTNQRKNGINRISIISLIEKVLSMQVYEPQNHINQTDEQNVAKSQNQTESKT